MDRREAILKASIKLFAKRGFHATATAEVAKEAGVAEGTIFHHFKTKEGILMCIFEEMTKIYIGGTEARLAKATTGLEAIEELIHFHFRFSEERSEELLVLVRDFPSKLMENNSPFKEVAATQLFLVIDLVKKSIERGQADGSIRELSPEEAALTLLGMLNGVSRLKLMGPLDVPDLTLQVVDFCRYGLGKFNSILKTGEVQC